MTPPMGGNCIPLMYQRFTVAILNIYVSKMTKIEIQEYNYDYH